MDTRPQFRLSAIQILWVVLYKELIYMIHAKVYVKFKEMVYRKQICFKRPLFSCLLFRSPLQKSYKTPLV